MKADRFALSDQTGTRVELCDTADKLDAIRDPDIDLVILQRALPAALVDWLSRLDPSRLPKDRLLVRPVDVPAALAQVFDDCGVSSGEMRDLLIDDVHTLVRTFAYIVRSEFVDVRLERVTGDACWKFHRDCVDARLLTTYLGPTTEWVHQEFSDQALSEQKAYDGPLERLQPNDVSVFKGSCAGPGKGIVHRSPPIAGTGKTRLLLCLNKPSDISPDPWQAGTATRNPMMEA